MSCRRNCKCHTYGWSGEQSRLYPQLQRQVMRGLGHHPSCGRSPYDPVRHRVDASRIVSGIYQGGIPPMGRAVRAAGFDVLVLAAAEYQPPAAQFPGVLVYHLPLLDDRGPVTPPEASAIRALSRRLAAHRHAGARILITCAAGLNRSGIITAATVRRLTRAPHRQIVNHIRAKRSPLALSNRDFVHAFTAQHLGSSPA